MLYDPERHHRRSIRLQNFDYSSAGAYFVTVCAHQRQCVFGEVAEGKMTPNEIGQIVEQAWYDLASRFPGVDLDVFVVMPNHMHGILVIQESPRRDGDAACHATTLGLVLRAFKSLSAIAANRALGRSGWPLWQRNYYDKIIRDDRMLHNARHYILDNPKRWPDDANNPVNLPLS